MERETIGKMLKFLEVKEGKQIPRLWNLIEEFENHSDGTQYKYKGDLHLENSIITKLPNDLYVTGNLALYNCKKLTNLPDKLYVIGGLYLGDLNIKELPNNLYVDYNLGLYNCTELTELPNDLYVGRDLYIHNTPLADKYTNEEIKEIVASTGGQIIGKISR